MMAYNEELTKAGVLLALDGLQPPAKGARVTFGGGTPRASPTARSPRPRRSSAATGSSRPSPRRRPWSGRRAARRTPATSIEVRQVVEMEDFPEDVQEVARAVRDAAASRPPPSGAVPADATQRAIDAVWRIESPRLIAGLARMVRDVGVRRGPRAGRARDGAGAVAASRASRTTRAPGSWPPPSTARSTCCAAARGCRASRRSWPATSSSALARRPRTSTRDRRRGRRRPAPPGLHHLPPGAVDRGAGGADAAAARRPHHRRDRARVPRARADGRPADQPGEATLAEARVPFEVPGGDELAARLAVGARGAST